MIVTWSAPAFFVSFQQARRADCYLGAAETTGVSARGKIDYHPHFVESVCQQPRRSTVLIRVDPLTQLDGEL